MRLRRFNNEGIERFRTFIGRLNPKTGGDKSLPAPMDLLEDDALTELIEPPTDCPDVAFANRLAAAEYLDKLLTPIGLADAFGDVGLWSWLALRFFDQIRPLKDGKVIDEKMGVDPARFIPTIHYQDRHRHLLRHPLQVLRMFDGNSEKALFFLIQPVWRPGQLVESLASKKEMTWHKGLLATLSKLYVDRASMSLKGGAGGKDEDPGSARRLAIVINQFDCTWDLGALALDPDHFIEILPEEFKKVGSYAKRRKTKVSIAATAAVAAAEP